MIDWNSYVGNVGSKQYEQRIEVLREEGIDTTSIEKTISSAIKNYNSTKGDAFIIFGEPQSGKTEMMIALNAKLLDEGCDVIINLLTDSVDLLNQSLSRFRGANLSPSPKQFSDLSDDAQSNAKKQWVLFSKKNARDLEKLSTSLRFINRLVIIDDEADYASPNSKINSTERTKINQLIFDLLKGRGKYIGVTATPARLDLNNTFENVSELWVDFDPHPQYVGQDFFFPRDGRVKFRLHQFTSDEGNERTELRNAIFHFLCGVAEQHYKKNQQNFTMLVHTSGKTDEHSVDVAVIHKTIDILSTPDHSKFNFYVKSLLKVAKEYDGIEGDTVKFILKNIFKNQIVVINSKGNKSNVGDILRPTTLFSFGVGGNIVSRGVTFDNLLSMYFTRTVKGKFTQDTYIQRARMFGNRSHYKEDFQLWVPSLLLQNWSKCFSFHQLAIQSVRAKNEAPVWLADHKTTPTSPASIDRTSVDFDGGVMSWALFDYIESKHERAMQTGGALSDLENLEILHQIFADQEFPKHVVEYLRHEVELGKESICFHKTATIGEKSKKYTQSEIDNVRRVTKGTFFSTTERNRGPSPNAKHHLKIFKNGKNKARLFYSINGHSIRFMVNRK